MVDRGFEPVIKEKETGWPGIRIMYISGATCLSTDCCFSEVALSNPANRVDLVQSEHHDVLIEN